MREQGKPEAPPGCVWGPFWATFAWADGVDTYSDPSWVVLLEDGGAMHCDGPGTPWHQLDQEDTCYVRGLRELAADVEVERARAERAEAERDEAQALADDCSSRLLKTTLQVSEACAIGEKAVRERDAAIARAERAEAERATAVRELGAALRASEGAALAEREACAKVAEDLGAGNSDEWAAAQRAIAEDIRARGGDVRRARRRRAARGG